MNRPRRAGSASGGTLSAAAVVSGAVAAAAAVSAAVVPAGAVLAAAGPAALRPVARVPAVSSRPAIALTTSAVTISAATASVSAPRPAGAPAGWRMVSTDHYGSASNASGYSAVATPGKNDAWVFGGTNPGEASGPTAQHWTGHRWQAVALPRGLGSFISGASASSPGNVWAISSFGGYALRWDGISWSVARRWRQGAEATSVTAISPTDVWLFGAPGHGQQGAGTWHFDGHSWIRITGRGSAIYRASALSGHAIWAITADARGGSVEHWAGHGWDRVRTGSALAGTELDDVLAGSPDSVWVVGDSPASAEDGRVVLAHWNGRTWRRTEARGRAMPRRLVADGHGGVWVAAVTFGAQTESRLLHLSRSGRWTQVDIARGLGNAVSDLALIPGTTSLWGSGGFLTKAGGDAAIWLYGTGRTGAHR
jgi:hypothetical protein